MKKTKVIFKRSRMKIFLSDILFWPLALLICFGVVAWTGSVGAYLVQGEFVKSVFLFVFGPIIIIIAISCCMYLCNKNRWYW